MTRTALSPRLSQHLAEPFLELHPQDALALGLGPAEIVEVTNPHGRALLRVLMTDKVARGHPFAPIHWTDQTASLARVDVLVPGRTDPVSGQPDSKAAAVALRRFPARWYAFAVAAMDVSPQAEYWARARVPGGWRLELAGTCPHADWVTYAREIFELPDAPAATVVDAARGTARIAFHQGGRLRAALFVSPTPVGVARDHLVARIGTDGQGCVLSGRPAGDQPDAGPIVCACLNIGRNTILAAIASGRAATVAELGTVLGAGSSCGSCRPELGSLMARGRPALAAE